MRYCWLIFIPFAVLTILTFTVLIDLFYFKNKLIDDTNLISAAVVFHIVILFIISYLCIIYIYFIIFISEARYDK